MIDKCIRYIITNDEENMFFKMGRPHVSDILQALYINKKTAEYHFNRCLNSHQKGIFTKVIPVEVSVTKLNTEEN